MHALAHLLVACCVLAAVVSAAPHAAVQGNKVERQGDFSLLEQISHAGDASAEVANKGPNLFCYVKYDDSKYPKQYFLNTANWEATYKTRSDYLECLTSGRGIHRRDFVQIRPESSISRDWYVEIRVDRNETANVYKVLNKRNEAVIIDVRGSSDAAQVSEKLPFKKELEPFQATTLLTVSKKALQPYASVNLEWQANPLNYTQSTSMKQVSSNGVTIVANNWEDQTYLTAYNDRKHDGGAPVHVTMDLQAQPGTDISNLDVGKLVFPYSFTVPPGEHVVIGVIQPKDITKPWLFGWNYKWQSGSSPRDVFGVDEV